MIKEKMIRSVIFYYEKFNDRIEFEGPGILGRGEVFLLEGQIPVGSRLSISDSKYQEAHAELVQFLETLL